MRALILALVIIILIIVVKRRASGFGHDSQIPKQIWTYWNSDELTPVVHKCINTWKKYNPDYRINIITPSNLANYLDFDVKNVKFNDSAARESDIIRLNVLAKYGGVWCDASILMTRPFDFKTNSDHEFVGYYIEHYTRKPKWPCIEGWFFATVPNGRFISAWRDAFMGISKFDSIGDWLSDLRMRGVDFQKTPEYMQNYLAINLAAQEALQQGMDDDVIAKTCHFMSANKGPYKHMYDHGWDNYDAVKSVCEPDQPTLVKFHNHDRKLLDTRPELHCVFDGHE
jgi:hypothetical protein